LSSRTVCLKWSARGLGPLVVALCGLLVPLLAQAQQKLLPAQSEIGFVSRQMGSPVEGRFRSFDAQVALDPKQLAAAKVVLVVDLASATLGSTETETELRQPDWFDVKKFPQATFTSSAVKPAGPGRIEVVGTFSLKGRSRALSVPVALTQAGNTTTATGAFTIRRLDFKVGDGDWTDTDLIANDVQVKFKLVLTGVAAL
jgi:polyisoprenoid-binding protein YceI